LTHETEAVSYPLFLDHYRRLCRELGKGQRLTLPDPTGEANEKPPLSREASRQRLAELKADLKLDE
jgi:hypothetical protein